MSNRADSVEPGLLAAHCGGTRYALLLVSVAAMGGLLFGYDTAVIAGAIDPLASRFQLNSVLKGWAVSNVLIGCMIGAAFAGALSDRFGRKRILQLAALVFAISAVGSALPRNLNELVAARMLGGLAVGAASMLSPLYIAEVSPARLRGRFVSLNQITIILGMLVVSIVNWQIASADDEAWNVSVGWRWMLASETLPALLFLGFLFLVPESPRWLVKQGREEEALAILARVGGAEQAALEMEQIRAAIAQEGADWRELFRPGIRAALLIAVVLAVLQQVTGINCCSCSGSYRKRRARHWKRSSGAGPRGRGKRRPGGRLAARGGSPTFAAGFDQPAIAPMAGAPMMAPREELKRGIGRTEGGARSGQICGVEQALPTGSPCPTCGTYPLPPSDFSKSRRAAADCLPWSILGLEFLSVS